MFLGSFVRFLWDLSLGSDLLTLLSLGSDLLGSLCNSSLACLLGLLVYYWLFVFLLACAAVGHWVEVSSVVTAAPWWVVPVLVAAISVRVAVAGGVTSICWKKHSWPNHRSWMHLLRMCMRRILGILLRRTSLRSSTRLSTGNRIAGILGMHMCRHTRPYLNRYLGNCQELYRHHLRNSRWMNSMHNSISLRWLFVSFIIKWN